MVGTRPSRNSYSRNRLCSRRFAALAPAALKICNTPTLPVSYHHGQGHMGRYRQAQDRGGRVRRPHPRHDAPLPFGRGCDIRRLAVAPAWLTAGTCYIPLFGLCLRSQGVARHRRQGLRRDQVLVRTPWRRGGHDGGHWCGSFFSPSLPASPAR